MNKQLITKTVYSFAGQFTFLGANFILFVILAKTYPTSLFGQWVLFMTSVSIADGLRQGFIQNGLVRQLVNDQQREHFIGAGLAINYLIIIIISLLFWVLGSLTYLDIDPIFRQAPYVFFAYGSLQVANSVYQAKGNFRAYFFNNLSYFLAFAGCMAFYRLNSRVLSPEAITHLMFLSSLPGIFIFAISIAKHIRFPKPEHFQSLLHFGKYASGTNLLSLLFQRVDIFMIGYFINPTAVAVFHFASKIVNYIELPLQALSQIIYPKLAASHLSNTGDELKRTYGQSILWLLAFIIPLSMILILFNQPIITLLGSTNYQEASPIIIILALATLAKPWGRIFGLTLDAIGKPKINFHMLVISLFINIAMNGLLIPQYGLIGAALATALSIIITIIIGQLNIQGLLAFNPLQEVRLALKSYLSFKIK